MKNQYIRTDSQPEPRQPRRAFSTPELPLTIDHVQAGTRTALQFMDSRIGRRWLCCSRVGSVVASCHLSPSRRLLRGSFRVPLLGPAWIQQHCRPAR